MKNLSTLQWRSETDAANEWHLLQPAPAENRGFAEASCYIFKKPFVDCSFSIDDEPLPDQVGNPSCWIWAPQFFAGEVTAELVGFDSADSVLFLLDVAPDANKIGRDFFKCMVNQLWEEDPILVLGTEPATTWSGEMGDQEDPWAAFARLRRCVPDALRAFLAIRALPRQSLRSSRNAVPLHQVRRVDRQTAAALLRTPAISLFGPDESELPDVSGSIRLDVPRAEETYDSAANRAMLALLLTLLRRTRALGECLQRLVAQETVSETRTSIVARWPKRKRFLDDLAVQLKTLLRFDPFATVQRAEITAAGLTAVASDPIYSRAWSRGWRALRRGLEFGATTERLWISPTWEIYERWCFLRLGKLLAATLPDWHWHRLPSRWVGSHHDTRGELLLQPTFAANKAGPARMWSLSKQRVPDIVLKLEQPNELRFVVLDAKYRSSRAHVLDAMESAHIYQDSLRIGSRRPEGSLLLIPSSGGAGWLENPTFQAEHRVGVHVLSPELDTALPSFVTELLKH